MLDPYHEVFRQLNPGEAPPSIGKAYGSQMQTSILPGNDSSTGLLSSYQQFATSLKIAPRSLNLILKNNPLTTSSKNLWVFGQKSTFAKKFKIELDRYGVSLDEKGVTIENQNFQWGNHSFVFTLNRYDSKDNQVTWVVASSKESIPGLIRKLPHYGKYGYLVFNGDIPENVAKGIWPSSREGLYHSFKKGTYSLPPKVPLIKIPSSLKN